MKEKGEMFCHQLLAASHIFFRETKYGKHKHERDLNLLLCSTKGRIEVIKMVKNGEQFRTEFEYIERLRIPIVIAYV